MLLQTLDDGIGIHRIVTDDDAAAFRTPFVAAYRRIFADPPYEESFTEAEATAVYDRLTSTSQAINLIAVLDGSVIGFGCAVPLTADGVVARELHGLVPVRHTIYLVELGVDPPWRGRQLAKVLIRTRIKLIDKERYSHVVLRVPAGRAKTFDLYRSLGFTDMGVSMQVSMRRTDGTVRTDERVFMSRVLSQVQIEEG
ncbi:MAG: GNAT family N-acetyltransferase [Alphaproteobacteria bacterium]|nr:GNAT family N-acetyltransferase [Alphaproteobacteria bacterium]